MAASLAARRAVSPVASEAWWERLGIITMARTIMIIIITITTIIINRGGQLEYELQRKRVKLTDDGSKLVESAGLILSDKFRNDASCPTSRLNKSGALGEILAKSEDREGYRAAGQSLGAPANHRCRADQDRQQRIGKADNQCGSDNSLRCTKINIGGESAKPQSDGAKKGHHRHGAYAEREISKASFGQSPQKAHEPMDHLRSPARPGYHPERQSNAKGDQNRR